MSLNGLDKSLPLDFTASQVFGLQALHTAKSGILPSQPLLSAPPTKDLPPITRDAIRTFDSDAQKLVREFQEAGWRGYLTERHHVMLLAPDGVTTASVSRDSLRGRSGRNARAKLTAWLREHSPKPGAAFGDIEFRESENPFVTDEDGQPFVMKTAMLASLKRNADLQAWMEANRGWRPSRLEVVGDADSTHAWAAFDNDTKPPTLVAMGADFTDDDAWHALHAQHPDMYSPKEQEVEPTVATVTEFECDLPECNGRKFKTRGAFNLHNASVHGPSFTCPVKGCGRVVKGAGGFARHQKTHELKIVPQKAAEPVAPKAEKVAKGKLPASDGVKVGSLNPEMDAAARRMAELPAGTTYDVLTDHLEHLPEGHDAEDMVARIRAIVAAPLVHEIRTLRAENARLTTDLADKASKLEEVETRFAMMREALNA